MSPERAATLSKPELGMRLERLRREMKAARLELLFVGHSVDLEYLLGVDRRVHHFGASHFFGEWAVGAVIRLEGEPLLLVPRHMAEFHFDVSADPPKMRVFTEKEDPRTVLMEAIGDAPSSIGINLDAPAELVLALQELFPRSRVALAAQPLARVRAVKSEAEIEAMRAACLLADQVFQESLAGFPDRSSSHNRSRSSAAALFRAPLVLQLVAPLNSMSDFLDPAGYETGLTALVGRGFQVNAVQILAPDELAPSTYGDLRLIDSETGAQQEVTFGKYRLHAYKQTVQNFCQRLREYCSSRGINFFTAPSDTPLEELLLKQLRETEVWG